ncbi:MAG: hypothetical protein IIC50_06035 [Planctomycetes bacterium]|nr:hypothetical protein [Planctomycetota bacterium]
MIQTPAEKPSSISSLLRSVACCVVLHAVSTPVSAKQTEFAQGVCTGHISSAKLRETSGMVASRQNAGILWMHNDSGAGAELFAVTESGETVASYRVTGASARDWEDIALGPGPEAGQDYLYIGDIGDNGAKRPYVVLYRVPEPRVGHKNKNTTVIARTSPAQALRLSYPDGPHDAETLLVDPLSGDLYIITKRDLFSRVYRASPPHSTTERILLEQVALMPWGFAVGGDISADGQLILIRGYSSASMFKRPAKGPLWQAFLEPSTLVPLRQERQGEAICFNAQGTGYYTTSEGKNQPIYFYRRTPPSSHPSSHPPTP